jgi:hypothetical protein
MLATGTEMSMPVRAKADLEWTLPKRAQVAA